MGLYARLAVDNIRKNRKLYVPYVISLAGMVALSYLLYYMRFAPAIREMRGAAVISTIMGMGTFVMYAFSVFFLLYTNAYLAKRRNYEFALYNILGMNKKNVVRIVLDETVITGVIGIVSGIMSGIVFSKLFEILLVRFCGYNADYRFSISFDAIYKVTVFFAAILVILFIFSAMKVIVNRPIELLRSSRAGEREPKTHYLLAIAGMAGLAVAYYMAVSIENPVESVNKFFVAVLIVIASTYLLFIAGSVFLCKLLKKSKNYYYNKRHFISVSGMVYRMKRNGAGLASICVLATMVLVMLGATGALTIGKAASLTTIYPREVIVNYRGDSLTADDLYGENIDLIKNKAKEVFSELDDDDIMLCRQADFFVNISGGFNIVTENDPVYIGNTKVYAYLTLIPLEDYNRINGTDIKLGSDEILLSMDNIKEKRDSITLGDRDLKVVGEADISLYARSISIIKTYTMVVPDFREISKYISNDLSGQVNYSADVGFDTALKGTEEEARVGELAAKLGQLCNVSSKSDAAKEFTELYASLLMLGVFLSIAFMGACAFIIYYKQITEGYEDAESFRIMRNVGMTVKEIKRGINTQTLVTFFSPLAVAALHLAFSGKMVFQMLMLFGLFDLKIFVFSYGVCFLAFAMFYLLIYLKTVKSYVEIVSA